jgi:hypothetical protein
MKEEHEEFTFWDIDLMLPRPKQILPRSAVLFAKNETLAVRGVVQRNCGILHVLMHDVDIPEHFYSLSTTFNWTIPMKHVLGYRCGCF